MGQIDPVFCLGFNIARSTWLTVVQTFPWGAECLTWIGLEGKLIKMGWKTVADTATLKSVVVENRVAGVIALSAEFLI